MCRLECVSDCNKLEEYLKKIVEKFRLNSETLKCIRLFDGQSACQLALFCQPASEFFNELGVIQILYTIVWGRSSVLTGKVVDSKFVD